MTRGGWHKRVNGKRPVLGALASGEDNMQELNVRSLWDAPSLTFYKTARNADGMWPVSHSCQLLQDPCMGVWPPLQRFGGRYLNLLGCLAWSLSSRGCVSHFCPVLDWICGGLGFSAFHAPGRKGRHGNTAVSCGCSGAFCAMELQASCSPVFCCSHPQWGPCTNWFGSVGLQLGRGLCPHCAYGYHGYS